MGNNKKYWKGLEELNQTPAFVESKKGEFSESIPLENVLNESGLNTKSPRRDFLKAMGFGLGAVTLAACTRTPVHKAVPYVIKPEEVTPGIPNFYASSYNGQSILVKTREGRPIAVEANTASTALSQGSEITAVTSVLDLYDMSKLQNPQLNGKDTEWSKLDAAAKAAFDKALNEGKQIAVVSESVHSPSALQALENFKAKYPNVTHIQTSAVSYSGIIKANERTFGAAVVPTYAFDQADVVVSVAADFLGSWLSGEEQTQDFMKGRDYKSLKEGHMSRHIQFETGLSLTGTVADVRIAIKPSEEGAVLIALYNHLTGQNLQGGQLKKKAQTAVQLAAQELQNNRGRALVVSGSNDPDIQALTNAINLQLQAYGKSIRLDRPSNLFNGLDEGFNQFLADAKAGQVGAALFWGVNPAYSYFNVKEVEDALSKVAFSISFAQRNDETASLTTAVAPDSTYLESWGDGSVKAGFYTVVQPTINPVFNTRQVLESLLIWSGDKTSAHDFVKNYWEENILPTANKSWKEVLQSGFVDTFASGEGSQPSGNVDITAIASSINQNAKALSADVELHLYQNTMVRDGKFANNAYLQELPDPVSKVTWDNYAAINPTFAKELGLKENDKVSVVANDITVVLPVLLQPGQAMNTVSIAVGYGREKAGKVGDNVGVNVYPLTRFVNGTVQLNNKAVVKKAGGFYELAQTQTHHTIEGRNIIRETTFAKYLKDPSSEAGRFSDDHKTYDLWNKYESPGHKWVMAIDLNACTGCGACIVACNVENNIPVVGRDEVRRRREMHWLRIDRYYTIEEDGQQYTKEGEIKSVEDFENVTVVHQPMLCQHCDHAPCETVCPVLATVHSSEGLNHMAYNRCFGTRYCANNCPYKVRRFNWFNYWNDSRFDNYLNNEFTQLMLNPDVTARSRGVMEKCSMCIQRIQAGKLQAKMDNRKVKDGDIKTACQSACPANAIIFGDINDPNSEVSKALKNERVYYVLEEINVQPNIGYMTKVRNTFEA